MGDHRKDWRFLMLDGSGKSARDKTNTTGVVGGLPPHGLVEGTQVPVIVASEVVAQHHKNVSERECARGLMGRIIRLTVGVAAGEIRMAVGTRMSDVLECILYHVLMGHIFSVMDRGSQNHLSNGPGHEATRVGLSKGNHSFRF